MPQRPALKTPSLRRLLVRLVAFTQLPGLLAAAAFLVVYHDGQQATMREELTNSALSVASALRTRLAQVEGELERLAPSARAMPDDLLAFYRQALYARDAAAADAIVLLDAHGSALLDTQLPFGVTAPNGAPAELARPLQTARTEVHGLLLRPGSGVATAGIGIPVLRDGRLLYALDAELAPRRFQELLEAQHLPDDWLAAIVDARGVIVARLPNPELVRGQGLPDELLAQVRGRENGVLEMRSAEGIPVVTAFRRSSTSGWTTFVSVPKSRLYASVLRSAAYLALLLAAAFGATAWLALRLRARVVASVDDLRSAAVALASGQPVAVRPPEFAEAAVVHDALRVSAEMIRSAHEELDQGEKRFAAIIQTAQEAIVVSDARHHAVVVMNDAALRMFGRHAGEPEASVRQLFSVHSWTKYLEHLEAAGPGAMHVHPWHGVGQHANGTTFPLEYSVSAFTDARGARFATLIARDITQRVRSEQALAAAQLEVRRVNERFQLALLQEADTRQAAIARELHDAVGSSLAAVSLLLGSVRSAAGAATSAPLIDKAQEQVRQIADRVRQISRGIMPAGSEGGALQQALEQFASEMAGIPGLACTVSRRGDFGDVSADVGAHLYRIVQEATNNALRHGGATRVRITLARAGAAYRLTVRDNGSGVDLAGRSATSPGLGLRSMEARARAIGGEFALSCVPGSGCRVQVAWRN